MPGQENCHGTPEFRVVLRLLARIAYVAVLQLKKNL
jgi:hypothetical protein